MLNFEGSFKYPGSTEGLPLMIGFAIVSDPSGKSLPNRYPQRREETIVVSIHVFRYQFVVALDVDRDGIVGDHGLELYRKHRERLSETEGSAQDPG